MPHQIMPQKKSSDQNLPEEARENLAKSENALRTLRLTKRREKKEAQRRRLGQRKIKRRPAAKITLAGGKTEHRPSEMRYKYVTSTGAPAVCGAQKRKKNGGGTCQMPAGWGTKHPGTGACKYHGGSSPTHLRKSWNDELDRLLGTEFEIDPLNALLWLIRIAAGDVLFWQREILHLQNEAQQNGLRPVEALKEDTIVGEQLILAGRKYEQAQERLAKHSKQAFDAGVTERMVRAAEIYGELISKLLQNVIHDLVDTNPDLSPQLKMRLHERAAVVIPQRLMELDQTGNSNHGTNGDQPLPIIEHKQLSRT
jgi:hypothetical protein